MSVADLPQCVQDCFKPVAEKLGCSDDDLLCLCTKDLDPSVGISFGLCVVPNPLSLGGSSGGCKGNAFSLYSDLNAICNKAGATASGSAPGSTPVATSNPPSKTDTNIPTESLVNTTDASSSPLLEAPQPSSGSASSGSSPGLSTGAAAGIGVGAAFFFMILALGLFLLWRRKRKQKKSVSTSGNDENETAEISGKPIVDAEAPGSSPQYELYGEATHTAEMDSYTSTANSHGLIIPMKEDQSASVVYELPADQSNTHAPGK